MTPRIEGTFHELPPVSALPRLLRGAVMEVCGFVKAPVPLVAMPLGKDTAAIIEAVVDGDWRKSTVTPEVLAPPTEASAEPEEEPAAAVASRDHLPAFLPSHALSPLL